MSLLHDKASIYLSTEYYQAIVNNKETETLNFEKQDIFSLGAVMLECLVGKLPDQRTPITEK